MELEQQLLENQIQELRAFTQRQRCFTIVNSSSVERQVVTLATSLVRKRERRPSDSNSFTTAMPISTRSPVLWNPIMAQSPLQTRGVDPDSRTAKRRKVEPVTQDHVDSLSMRLVNWLLPSVQEKEEKEPQEQPQDDTLPHENQEIDNQAATIKSMDVFKPPMSPTKGAFGFPPLPAAHTMTPNYVPPSNKRRTLIRRQSSSLKPKRKSTRSPLQALETWIFPELDERIQQNDLSSIDLVHAQMQAER